MARGILEIDGRRIELTDEQVEELLKGKDENLFKRVNPCDKKGYYFIGPNGKVMITNDTGYNVDKELYDVANYCTNKELMQQRALHEILDRLLWRFSMENDGDKIDWNNKNKVKYKIYQKKTNKVFYVENNYEVKNNTIYFYSYQTAKQAIKEIIEPFMKEHPEFVW